MISDKNKKREISLSAYAKINLTLDVGGLRPDGYHEIASAVSYTHLERQEKYGKFVLNVDKRYAFLTPQYVLLTPEVSWYPRTGVTYSTEDVSWNHPEFSRFDLHVKTEPGLQAISQGEISETSPGQFTFTNNVPLTQISLAIGDYEKKSIQTDSIEFGIWHFRGHDYFLSLIHICYFSRKSFPQ